MFTGIIEHTGIIQKVINDRSNKTFWIKSDIASQVKVDESVSHNGVCLTIEEIEPGAYRVTAIAETLHKSNAAYWNVSDIINLERPLAMNGRLDGHIVQGHVDGTATCIEKQDQQGSTEFTFSFNEKDAALVIEKGSVCINGVSLTAYNVTNSTFTVAIIPYTFTHTNFKKLAKDTIVNIEFDMLGKYVARIIKLNGVR